MGKGKNLPMRSGIGALLDQAIKDQQIILGLELEKGVPLNYVDESGQYVLRHPDGRVERTALTVREACRR